MAKLPKSLQLAGMKWSLHTDTQSPDDTYCFGETDTHDLSITLYTRPHEDCPKRGGLKQTLFHECIHAALFSTGAGNLLTDSKEEALVVALEHALWPLIQAGLFK